MRAGRCSLFLFFSSSKPSRFRGFFHGVSWSGLPRPFIFMEVGSFGVLATPLFEKYVRGFFFFIKTIAFSKVFSSCVCLGPARALHFHGGLVIPRMARRFFNFLDFFFENFQNHSVLLWFSPVFRARAKKYPPTAGFPGQTRHRAGTRSPKRGYNPKNLK